MKYLIKSHITLLYIFISLNSALANGVFKNLNIDNGLVHTDVLCVAQDSTGLIWLGTNSGVQSYDGYSLKFYDYYDNDKKIYKSHNRILSMAYDKNRLWIGTKSGLTCINTLTHKYSNFKIKNADNKVLEKSVNRIIIDDSGYLWISMNEGLFVARYKEDTETLVFYDWENQNEKQKSVNILGTEKHNKQLWAINNTHLLCLEVTGEKLKIKASYELVKLFGANNSISNIAVSANYLYARSLTGCYQIPFLNNQIQPAHSKFINFNSINPAIPGNTFGVFVVDKNENLWCTYFGGLFEVTQPYSQQPSIRRYFEEKETASISRIDIRSLYIDSYNNIWVPSINYGVSFKTISKSAFHLISNEKFEMLGFTKNGIAAIEKDKNGFLWMLTDGGGLFNYEIRSQKLKHIYLPAITGKSYSFHSIKLSNDQSTLYIGMKQGLISYNIKTGSVSWLMGTQAAGPQNTKIVIAVLEIDNFGRLWIGSWGKGVYCMDFNGTKNKIVNYFNTKNSRLLSDYITDIYSEQNKIMICTDNGLNKISLNSQGKTVKIISYQANESLKQSMSTNFLASIDKENDSVYWIGTIGGGLNKVTLKSERDNDYKAEKFTTQNGLTYNDVEIVYLDKRKNVWLGGNGITRLEPKTGKMSVYETVDGLQSNSFKIGAGHKSEDGTLYMGGINGLNYFSPQDLHTSENKINLIFTDLYIHNKTIKVNETDNDRIVLKKILNETEKVKLNYKQNDFTISFSALGYNLSNRVMYRYRMIGYDNNWQLLPYTQNKVFYSNLKYGNYKFELQASTDRGFTWKTPSKTIKFIITAPWWQTSWAKLFYVLAVLSVSFYLIYRYKKYLELKRENQLQEMKRLNEQEMFQSKLNFFMSVSHELKTPLTLITLAAEKIAEKHFTLEHKSILSNAKRMLSLITELVDIRKADLGIKQMNFVYEDIDLLIRQLFDEIQLWATEKHITMSYKAIGSNIYMDYDKEKIAKLIVNLFSNAIKYTANQGEIKIQLQKGKLIDIKPKYKASYKIGDVGSEDELCIIVVQDSGVGISPESISLIYERFFQIKNNNSTHLGSGIGLAIAKNMVLLHDGCIVVSSERMVGTEFIVGLPIRNSAKNSTLTNEDSFVETKQLIEGQYLELNSFELPVEKLINSTDKELPTMLIVEDNKELLLTLREHFSEKFTVKIAENGKIGLAICRSIFPDIIISDVMMPEMDGIEMCKTIRNELSISYIPIILLTAREEVENQIEGYESGADLYLSKPFSIKLLDVNVEKLLSYKEKQFRYSSVVAPLNKDAATPDRVELLNDENKKFENDLKNFIENNMENPDLSIEILCQEFGISRTNLYIKVKEVCQQSVADYIRNLRLERACYLLDNSTLNISEIIFEVGFVNNSHFAKVFKLKYDMTPSEYIKRIKK